MYLDIMNKTCNNCPVGCATCVSQYTCTACNIGYNSYLNMCWCGDGFGINHTNFQC